MAILEIQAKSLLIRRHRVDAWFVSSSGMNLYRGCAHDCAYCDGRAEGYYVAGEFGRDVAVKTNAIDVLRRELTARRLRRPRRAYVLVGGGVGDSFQPVEAQYGLARQALEALLEAGLPVHVLTKSPLVERDFDLLSALHARAGVLLSMSLSSARDDLGASFEPGCARPSRRLETLRRAKQHGLPTGVYLMPVIPGVSDGAEVIDESLARCAEAGVDFVVCGGMTLKSGRQRQHFLEVLGQQAPDLVPEVARHYGQDRWGLPDSRYYATLGRRFAAASRRHRLPGRIPPRLWPAQLDANERVAVILDGIDGLLRLEGRVTSLGRAAASVAALEAPLASLSEPLSALAGVGPRTERLIAEILERGSCALFEALLAGVPADEAVTRCCDTARHEPLA